MVHVVRKNIKNLNLRVCPPDGEVRVSAPIYVSDNEIRNTILRKLSWIEKHQARIQEREPVSKCIMQEGEVHFFLGKTYKLNVIEQRGKHKVEIGQDRELLLCVRPGTGVEARQHVINEWYRNEIKALIPAIIEKWEPVIGVKINDWGVKKMKTRWGTCNIQKARIWLSLELAKRPVECLEYVVVHEMVHLHERYHNARFKSYMDSYIPGWRLHHDALNQPQTI